MPEYRDGLNRQARNPETIRWWQRLTGFVWQIGPHRHHDKVRQVGTPRDMPAEEIDRLFAEATREAQAEADRHGLPRVGL